MLFQMKNPLVEMEELSSDYIPYEIFLLDPNDKFKQLLRFSSDMEFLYQWLRSPSFDDIPSDVISSLSEIKIPNHDPLDKNQMKLFQFIEIRKEKFQKFLSSKKKKSKKTYLLGPLSLRYLSNEKDFPKPFKIYVFGDRHEKKSRMQG